MRASISTEKKCGKLALINSFKAVSLRDYMCTYIFKRICHELTLSFSFPFLSFTSAHCLCRAEGKEKENKRKCFRDR